MKSTPPGAHERYRHIDDTKDQAVGHEPKEKCGGDGWEHEEENHQRQSVDDKGEATDPHRPDHHRPWAAQTGCWYYIHASRPKGHDADAAEQ